MRTRFEREPDLLTVPISSARFPKNCRDEAPKILKSLQVIYLNERINEAIFSLLSARINREQEELIKSGRHGMGLWEILVLGVMRQGLNTNYDRIHYLANSDVTMRTVMGIETGFSLDRKEYSLTTIKDNLALLDEQTIQEINTIMINYGHILLKKRGRTPSGKS
jgi:IS5 family transposase